MTKQELLKMVEGLPEETCSEGLDKIAAEVEKLQFRSSVERGLRQADDGEGTSHDDFVDRFKRRFQG